MSKQNVIYMFKGILLGNKKDWISDNPTAWMDSNYAYWKMEDKKKEYIFMILLV